MYVAITMPAATLGWAMVLVWPVFYLVVMLAFHRCDVGTNRWMVANAMAIILISAVALGGLALTVSILGQGLYLIDPHNFTWHPFWS